jgi:hypothetical protein
MAIGAEGHEQSFGQAICGTASFSVPDPEIPC